MPEPKVSVIIPVRNEAKRIRQCIEGLISQTIKPHEIIVIDSGSTDGTLEILSDYQDVIVIPIPPDSFNHGLTRNMGVQAATGDYCLLTVGDAYACNQQLIEILVSAFEDNEVAAVCGQQIVEHIGENNPLQWFRPSTPPTTRKVHHPNGAWDRLTPKERKLDGGWDDVIAMYRREALIQQPFKETSYSEDILWVDECLRSGKAVVYNSSARVFHFHLEDADFAYKRTLTAHYFRYRTYGCVPSPLNSSGFKSTLSRIRSVFFRSQLPLAEALYWWRYNQSRIQAINKATLDFHRALNISEEELDNLHTNHCGKPPIPVKQ